MKRRTTLIAAAAALIACLPLAQARADIFQYTDENGVLNFTNVNGDGRKHKRVRSEPAQAGPATTQAPAGKPTPSHLSSSNIPSVYLDIINSACERHGVDPSLVHAIVKVESDFNPYATSNKGAMGLMQLMPETAVNMNVRNTFNPAENIDGGVKYLRYLIDRYEGNLSLALAAYNSGETAVRKWGTIPPFKETQSYVQRIMKIYNGGTARSFATGCTIYMGYSEDGSLVLTDNPSGRSGGKLKARKKSL
ncbi:MAG TPA: lytic transglycosylase domain-containing protein [Nitrospirota bacterium]|nr:lytic transglycosylase domain-containing protein [Nitrospirota bacterium]